VCKFSYYVSAESTIGALRPQARFKHGTILLLMLIGVPIARWTRQ
jgi:hypothetical protein